MLHYVCIHNTLIATNEITSSQKERKIMGTCTSCGRDVSGKKFCPDCGTPIQAAPMEAATSSCPRCGGSIKASAAFCMHCGSSLGAQALSASAMPITAVAQPVIHQCPACHVEVPNGSAFCTNCGQSIAVGQMSASPALAASSAFCTHCGVHNNPGSRFCNSCGQTLTPGAPIQNNAYQPTNQQPYGQPNSSYAQQPNSSYAQQPQYNTGYPQQPYGQPNSGYPQQPQYNTGYPQQPYGQANYQQVDPMLGQAPMALRCPVCMAMAPQGTPACLSCRTSLAGIVPTPSTVPMQGQQQGGLGGMFQGSNGKMAMGALGGAAAVIGGEMLLHNMEHHSEYEQHGERRDEGLLGGLGDIAKDIGLF
jgi:double zinc ribbon protein